MISLDKDFQRFKDESLIDHPGVILLTVGNNTPAHINAVLQKALKNLSAGSLKEALVRATINKLVKEKQGKIEEKLLYRPKSKWTEINY